MIVSYEEIAIVFVLHLDEVLERSEVVAQVQVSGWAYAAYYSFHFIIVFVVCLYFCVYEAQK